jgi:glycosyltransferase involved in cell wall biosynthesis
VLEALDIFVLPSLWEGEPIALLEAMASGLPCVATRTSGAREVLEGTGAGVLVEVGSPPALARAIRELIEDQGRRRAMGEAARRSVAGRSWPALAERVAEVYREVSAEGSPGRA